MTYPPYTITSAILKRVANISEQLAARAALTGLAVDLLSPHLRRANRIRTIHASLAIENNTLSLEQVTDIIDGKAVMGPPSDIQEVHGAVSAYERLDTWQPHKPEDMLSAHAVLSTDECGLRRTERMFSVLMTCRLNKWSFADLMHGAVRRPVR